jgi:hypothetical protein
MSTNNKKKTETYEGLAQRVYSAGGFPALNGALAKNAEVIAAQRATIAKLRKELGYVQRDLENEEMISTQYCDAFKVTQAELAAWRQAFQLLAKGKA